MAEPTEPIITGVPDFESFADVDKGPEFIDPTKDTAGEVITIKEGATKALENVTGFMSEPARKGVDFTMGDVENRAIYALRELGPRTRGLDADQQLLALNSLDRIAGAHLGVQTSEQVAHYVDMIKQDLEIQLYGNTGVEKITEEKTLSKGSEGAALEWSGAPITVQMGEVTTQLVKDGKLGWVYTDARGDRQKVKNNLGRNDFERATKPDSLMSREHLLLQETSKGELVLSDVSLNGTLVRTERYPTPAEFAAQQKAAHEAAAKQRKSGARNRIKNLFGRK